MAVSHRWYLNAGGFKDRFNCLCSATSINQPFAVGPKIIIIKYLEQKSIDFPVIVQEEDLSICCNFALE